MWLRLTESGALVLEGQDLGGGVSAFFGPQFSEYEWAWTVPRERVGVVLDSLGVSGSMPDAFDEVGRRLELLEGSVDMQKPFEDAGAEFWSRVGE